MYINLQLTLPALTLASLLATGAAEHGLSGPGFENKPIPPNLFPRATTLSPYLTPQNATSDDIKLAEQIVQNAMVESGKRNQARMEHPLRNRYRLRPGSKVVNRDEEPPPLLKITDEIARAAALLTNLRAQEGELGLPPIKEKRDGNWWMEDLDRMGTVPFGGNPDYQVFRNVKDFGADPTGKQDSTFAFTFAASSGGRCSYECDGSTTTNAIVYIPPGQYLISSSVALPFGTQLIGDAKNRPTIVATQDFVGLGVLATDVYVDNGGTGPDGGSLEWYINTARFYSQIRNIKIDITRANSSNSVAALHYQVAQATTIENVEFTAKRDTTQQGIFAENGSGGSMSDLVFKGGKYGIYGGSQQFSASRITFDGCNTGVQLIWDWGWIWKSLTVTGVDVGFRLYNDASGELPGSITIMDSIFSNIGQAAIEMAKPSNKTDEGFTGLVLDNVNLGGPIKEKGTGNTLQQGGKFNNFVIGTIYQQNKRDWSPGKELPYTREASLLGAPVSGLDTAPYFERPRNQYTNHTKDDFVHLKSAAKGDGSTDDTSAIQSVLDKYGDGSKIIYVDSGSYIITNTLNVTKETKLVGEAWSQIIVDNSRFLKRSLPAVRIGQPGDVGNVEIQDLIIGVRWWLSQGATLVEWNVAAQHQGTAALWDTHVRIGGANGTKLTSSECSHTGNPSNIICGGTALMMHITEKASGYFDNMWLWVADHMIDDPLPKQYNNSMDMLSIYNGRGMLIESKQATWLYGTSSEHSILYQYNFHKAKNIFTTFLQTETPYFQPNPPPPAQFNDTFFANSDPSMKKNAGDVDHLDSSWAVIMTGCENIHIGAAGTYSFFQNYAQTCVDSMNCQKSLWLLDDNYQNVKLSQVVTIGAENMIVTSEKGLATAADNLAVSKHPKWSQISQFDVVGSNSNSNKRCDDFTHPYFGYSEYSSRVFRNLEVDQSSGPGSRLDNGKNATAAISHVTVVNFTPYKLVYTPWKTPYQIEKVEFQDIESGKAAINNITYTEARIGSFDDTNGYFNYTLQGTNKRFTVHAGAYTGQGPGKEEYQVRIVFDLGEMGLGWREYAAPGSHIPVTLIIMGSEEFGYSSSLQFQPINWMNAIKEVISDRQLAHVVMPGSHDAAMYTLSKTWRGGGTDSNIATQYLGHYDQLKVGTRFFDMRLVSVNNKTDDFWSAHLDNENGVEPVGNSGPPLSELIRDVNRFTQDYPGEVIIWAIRYMVNLNLARDTPASNHWNDTIYTPFYDLLETINNRCPSSLLKNGTSQFNQVRIGDMLNTNDKKGCVLLIVNPQDRGHDPSETREIYSTARVNVTDVWGMKETPSETMELQVQQLHQQTRLANDPLYISQWKADPGITVDIRAQDWYGTNPGLYYYGINNFSPKYFPTIIEENTLGVYYLDKHSEPFFDSLLQNFVVGMNLYMVSQNCDLTSVGFPLKAPTTNNLSRFSGVAFFNGTVLDKAPPGFDRGYTYP